MRILQTPVDLERSLEEHHNYIRLQRMMVTFQLIRFSQRSWEIKNNIMIQSVKSTTEINIIED